MESVFRKWFFFQWIIQAIMETLAFFRNAHNFKGTGSRVGCLRYFVSSKFRIFRMFFYISYTIRKWQQFRENNRNWRLILGPWRLILGPCRLTLEPCMLTWSFGGSPWGNGGSSWARGGHPGDGVHPLAGKAHPEMPHLEPFLPNLWLWRLTLDPWRFIF